MIILLLIIAAALGLFYFLLQLQIPGTLKFIAIVVEMLLVSQVFIRRYKLPSELGLVLLKSKKGIELIDRFAKKERIFNLFSDIGNCMAYGLLSLAFARKRVSVPSMVAGLLLLTFASFFVAPFAFVFLSSVMNMNLVDKQSSGIAASIGQDIGAYVVGGILLVGGLFLFVLAGIILYGGIVFSALVKTIFLGSDAIAKTSAGGTFLLPGINIPFVEGILALAVVMIVHEGAHAVLARIGRVPVLSSGIVLFGIIPIGAFVEPDEKKLERTDETRQTRVLVAGSSANLFASCAFFLVFFAFFLATPDYREQGLLVLSGMEPGTIIHAADGNAVELDNYTGLHLAKNATVLLSTNKGDITRTTDGDGKLGITIAILKKSSIAAVYDNQQLQFIFTFLGLVFALNFIVGAVNLLPIPLFDGYRIIDVNVKNKLVVKTLTYVTLAFFILNFVPLLFH